MPGLYSTAAGGSHWGTRAKVALVGIRVIQVVVILAVLTVRAFRVSCACLTSACPVIAVLRMVIAVTRLAGGFVEPGVPILALGTLWTHRSSFALTSSRIVTGQREGTFGVTATDKTLPITLIGVIASLATITLGTVVALAARALSCHTAVVWVDASDGAAVTGVTCPTGCFLLFLLLRRYWAGAGGAVGGFGVSKAGGTTQGC